VVSPELSQATRNFIARYIRSVEQLEILLLIARNPAVTWTAEKVYDAILSAPASVAQWLEELAASGLVESTSEIPGNYRSCRDEALVAEIAGLDKLYRSIPVRVIETIYKRETSAAQSFADAFKIKSNNPSS
jgi:hypothetical protein